MSEPTHNRSDAWLATAFNMGPVILVITRLATGRFVEVNERFLTTTGYTREEVLGRTPLEMELWINPGQRAEGLNRLREGQPVREIEAQFRMKSGEIRTWLMSADLIELNGETGVLTALTDITERKHAEAALRASQDRLAGIVTSAMDAIITVDDQQRIMLFNRAAEQLFGYTAQELAGQPLERIIPHRFRRAHQGHIAHFGHTGVTTRAMGELGAISGLRVDGSEFPIEAAISQVEAAGHTLYTVILRDITTRRQAEVERAELLERAQSARVAAEAAKRHATFLADASRILASSIDYPTTLTNVAHLAVPSLADWCGVYLLNEQQAIALLAVAHNDPAKVAIAHALFRQHPPSFTAPSGIGAVLRTGRAEVIAEISDAMLVAAAQDATHLEQLRTMGFISIMIVPLIARGRTLAALTFVSSQPERLYGADDVRVAEELALRAAQAIDNAQLYQDMQQAVQLRDQFLSLAAHELKTPLTSLTGQVQLFLRRAEREKHLTERDERTIRIISDQVGRLNKMVLALLDISRLEMGQLTIERVPVDLCALLRNIIDAMQSTVDDRQIELAYPAQSILVSGDALRLEQVFQNLLQNALKYSQPPEPISVVVTQTTDQVCVAVEDHGIGIPSAALAHVFQRFYRADNVEEQHLSGMGIGLYVVNEIVTLHGGTVTVDSTEGVGSTFTVVLPRDRQMEGHRESS
jgi:PAS domain S-box-containing protein